MYEPIYYYNKELINPECNLFAPLEEEDDRRDEIEVKEEILATILPNPKNQILKIFKQEKIETVKIRKKNKDFKSKSNTDKVHPYIFVRKTIPKDFKDTRWDEFFGNISKIKQISKKDKYEEPMEPLSEEIKEQIDAIIKQYKNINKNDDWDDFFNEINKLYLQDETKKEIEKIKDNYNKINGYIETIIDGINEHIKDLYAENYKQINSIKTYDKIVDEIIKKKGRHSDRSSGEDYGYESTSCFVDNYCKISHIIHKNKIYPILPVSIKDDFELVYEFDTDKLRSLEKVNKYIDYDIKGIIVNDEKLITDIIYTNNSYIAIKPTIKYDEKKHNILGNIKINNINNILQTNGICNDSAYKFNNEFNYIKYFTTLTIQSIIYYIKNYTISCDYYTKEHGTYFTNEQYNLKITQQIINGKKFNFVDKNNDFYGTDDESHKFTGKIIKQSDSSDIPHTPKLEIEIKYIDIINIVLNDKILLNYDKQRYLSDIIYEIINKNKIFIYKNKQDYKDSFEKLEKNIHVFTDKTYSDKCYYNNIDNKLIINIKENPNKKIIFEKAIWNFIELLLINKDIDAIYNILQNNIDKSDLCKTEKNDEICFNYSQFINNKLDEIFKYKSIYIQDINFYDYNDSVITTNKQNTW